MEITIYINLYIVCFIAGMAVSIIGYKLYPIICKMIISKKHNSKYDHNRFPKKKPVKVYEGDFEKVREGDFEEVIPL